MQAGATVATFSELEENFQSCTTPSDLGISEWGGRYVGHFVTVLLATCADHYVTSLCQLPTYADKVALHAFACWKSLLQQSLVVCFVDDVVIPQSLSQI